MSAAITQAVGRLKVTRVQSNKTIKEGEEGDKNEIPSSSA
jgi:hypothetical protein